MTFAPLFRRTSQVLPTFAFWSLSLLGFVACSAFPNAIDPLVELGGVVTDPGTGKAVVGAFIAVYSGGPSTDVADVPFAANANDGNATDANAASPTGGSAGTTAPAGDENYLTSAITDASGAFTVDLPPGTYHAWVFAPGYACARTTLSGSTAITLTPVTTDALVPAITGPVFAPTRALPTQPVSFTTQIFAQDTANDPLQYVFLVYPRGGMLLTVNAPGAALANGGWPNGAWARDFNAPVSIGDLNVTVVAATQKCLCAFSTNVLTVAR